MADDVRPYEFQTEGGISIALPSGATYSVITDGEAHYMRDKIERYLSDNKFVNVSDMQDIDRMIVFELLIHRWTLWLSRGRDYYDEDISVKTYADMVKQYSVEVRQLKSALGVDKSSRDRMRGDDSIPALWENLLRRGKEFGFSRNEQFYQVLTSFQRLKAIVIFHSNCNEVERRENACTTEDVMEVLREELAKFDAIDEKFRFEKQTTWVRSQ